MTESRTKVVFKERRVQCNQLLIEQIGGDTKHRNVEREPLQDVRTKCAYVNRRSSKYEQKSCHRKGGEGRRDNGGLRGVERKQEHQHRGEANLILQGPSSSTAGRGGASRRGVTAVEREPSTSRAGRWCWVLAVFSRCSHVRAAHPYTARRGATPTPPTLLTSPTY